MTIELRGDSKPSTLVVIKSTEDNEMEQFDKDNYTNPQYVIPYINDIMINMRATEVKFIKNSITTFYIGKEFIIKYLHDQSSKRHQ